MTASRGPWRRSARSSTSPGSGSGSSRSSPCVASVTPASGFASRTSC
jgi:DNA-directed RNA polymerase, sigma subunit (sigma70/sigma32)